MGFRSMAVCVLGLWLCAQPAGADICRALPAMDDGYEPPHSNPIRAYREATLLGDVHREPTYLDAEIWNKSV